MSPATYPGIRFPDRAEALESFDGYRVFLDPWAPIADALRPHWEAAARRSASHIFAIHGPQGAGKTLLTRKLGADFETSKRDLRRLIPDENNFWHRVSGGREFDGHLIREATGDTDFLIVKNESTWPAEAEIFAAGQRADARVLLADNAERAYFRQGLVEMTDMQFLEAEASPALNRLAAQRLVDKLRTTLRGTLLVLLSNSSTFLNSFQAAVEEQHRGMMSVTNLELPGAREKETVIRVNTNRLNPSSYWSAIDQGTIHDREALREALNGDTTFPDSFRAVDTAAQNRTGRPALRNVITLIVLANLDDAADLNTAVVGDVKRTEVEEGWMSLRAYENSWAPPPIGDREGKLLEPEWTLRVAVLGNPFVRSLLAAGAGDADQSAQVGALLSDLQTFQGPGTRDLTRQRLTERFIAKIRGWVHHNEDVSAFWNAGQGRSVRYESALSSVLAGYNTSSLGFLSYRPDYVVSPFSPAAVSDAPDGTNDAIRAAIQRTAHVFEFTAINVADPRLISNYLGEKLPNYVQVVQEQ